MLGKQIDQIKEILQNHNIMEGVDYIISLQGPTVIPTIQGKTKITPQVIDDLIPTGAGIML
jgi:hypothetical protein